MMLDCEQESLLCVLTSSRTSKGNRNVFRKCIRVWLLLLELLNNIGEHIHFPAS